MLEPHFVAKASRSRATAEIAERDTSARTRGVAAGGLRLGRRQRRAARGHGERLHVRLPLRRELEELHAVQLCAVDIHCTTKKKKISINY